jgi:hypothetical protein
MTTTGGSAPPYRIVVLGVNPDWAAEVGNVCVDSTTRTAGAAGLLSVETRLLREDPAGSPPQTLVVFLADSDSRDRTDLLEQVNMARDAAVAVLPVVHSGADVQAVLPEILRPLNAVRWEQHGDAVALDVLRLLGLVERHRRLFLSYRRQETSALAINLREHLSRRTFDVFLDRFSVPPADDFQRRIDIELSDKAFVLLLESTSAVRSQWVQHEVAFALSHGISLMALTLPDVTDDRVFSVIDEAFRYRLVPEDLHLAAEPGQPPDLVLTPEALGRVLEEVESRYARQLRQRRGQLIGSLREWLVRSNRAIRPTANEWALAATGPDGRPTVYLVTPQAPAPADLQELDRLRRSAASAEGRRAHGYLLHGAPVQDPDEGRLIAWIVGRRPLSTCAHHRVPDLLGL